MAKSITPEELKALRKEFLVGARVKCISLNDQYNPVPKGTKGVVDTVDDIGTVHVHWDNGSSLGAVWGVDKIARVTVRLHITMAYTFVGDTGIDIPAELIEGKTEEEAYNAAFLYAQDHIDEIPVADNAKYVADSDEFEPGDIDFDDEEGLSFEEGGED